jgi:3-oxoacyl-(acyl-carrier-protein) synthase
MSKDYDNFNRFDLNEACDFFDCELQKNWKKINKFVVADGADTAQVLEDFGFDRDEIGQAEYEAFDAGVKYVLTRMQEAFEAAGLELEIKEADLGEAMGFMLTRVDDDAESFVKRVLKKPVMVVEGWV